MNTETARSWEVVDFKGQSTEPYSIRRTSDGEVFSVGDYVTNGTKMKGYIEKFEYSFKSDDIFVYTDWSGVGMNLGSLQLANRLPSGHQIGDKVVLSFGSEGSLNNCTVNKVHFSAGKVMYDVEVHGRYEQTSEHPAGIWTTRLYNVDSVFVTKPTI